MSKLLERTPDWPADDWAKYFNHTWVINPASGNPSFVAEARGDGLVLRDGKHVMLQPHAAFTWQHLRHPKLGWAMLSGFPVYVFKKPLRDLQKGFRKAALGLILPAYLEVLLDDFVPGESYVHYLYHHKVGDDFVKSLYTQQTNTLEQAITALEQGALALVLNKDAALTLNPDPSNTEFPYILFVGPAVAGYVRKDGSVKQTTDADISEALYANAA